MRTDFPRTATAAATLSFSILAALTVSGTASAQAAADAATDHSRVVGHIGAAYFEQFDVPLADKGEKLPTQVIGIRYWFQDRLALDAGLGFYMTSGSTTANNTSTDKPSTLAFTLHGGVPIALFDGKHYTFYIEPLLIFGHAGRTTKLGNGEVNETGNRLQLGGLAGGEFHFGFAGLPQLALNATIGLGIELAGGATKTNPGSSETSFSTLTVATLTGHQPWNIFNTNVAATYYF